MTRHRRRSRKARARRCKSGSPSGARGTGAHGAAVTPRSAHCAARSTMHARLTAKHSEVRPMTPDQFREAIERLGLNITHAAAALDISRRNAQRYASGETDVPGPVAKLLRLAVRYKVDADVIAKL